MRSLLAILVGYLIFGVSAVILFRVARVDPHQLPGIGFMIGSTIYGVFFAIAAGYTAARIAGKKELVHAGVVACLLALLAFISIIAQPGLQTHWSQITAIIFMAPAAAFGGWFRTRQARIKKETPK